jgi:hypothetical protein
MSIAARITVVRCLRTILMPRVYIHMNLCSSQQSGITAKYLIAYTRVQMVYGSVGSIIHTFQVISQLLYDRHAFSLLNGRIVLGYDHCLVCLDENTTISLKIITMKGAIFN